MIKNKKIRFFFKKTDFFHITLFILSFSQYISPFPLPQNMDEITRILREEIEYRGLSVIIPRRECIQTLKRHAKERAAQKEEKKA